MKKHDRSSLAYIDIAHGNAKDTDAGAGQIIFGKIRHDSNWVKVDS
jgi:hypothetical protein